MLTTSFWETTTTYKFLKKSEDTWKYDQENIQKNKY